MQQQTPKIESLLLPYSYLSLMNRSVMNRLHYILPAIVFVFFSLHAHAQENEVGGITIHSDPRLSILLKKTHTTAPLYQQPATSAIKPTKPYKETAMAPTVIRERKTVYKGKGFRVQIYNGSDRAKAMQIKSEFMRHFPGVPTYLTYISPAFRVKVGDYRNRSDAAGMMKEANSMYSPCMIVPDIVTISNY